MADVMFDRQDQLDKISGALVQNETLHAVLDMKGGSTGFLGITNKRVIVYDQAFIGKRKAVVSIPYSRISAIAAEDEGGMLRGFFGSSTITLTYSGGQYTFEFRGADKAHIAHNMILHYLL
jgi:hypothetical protein